VRTDFGEGGLDGSDLLWGAVRLEVEEFECRD